MHKLRKVRQGMPNRRYYNEIIFLKKIPALFLGLAMALFSLNPAFSDADWQSLYSNAEENIQKALEILEGGYKQNHSLDTLEKLVVLLMQAEKYDKVIELVKPRQIEASDRLKSFLGCAYFEKGQYPLALKAFESVEGDLEDFALFYYAQTCEKLNLYPQAIQALEKIPSSSKLYAVAQVMLRSIVEEGKVLEFQDIFPEDVLALLKKANIKNYPQSSLVIIKDEQKVRVWEDGTVEEKNYSLFKVLNQRGIEKIGELSLQYDATDELLTINQVRVISPLGKVIKVGKKHIRDVSLYNNFPLYSNARARIISLPSLEEGSIVELSYTKKILNLIDDKFFSSFFQFSSLEPVMRSSYSIAFPKDMGIKNREINRAYKDKNARFSFKKDMDKKGYVLCQWRGEDISQIIPEPNMVAVSSIANGYALSNFSSWDQVYNWWWNLAKDKIEPDNPSIKQAVAGLISGAKDDRAKASAIYTFCTRDVRYVAVEYGRAGYEPHSASEILSNMYGDCKDQSILLVSMLRCAGIEAYPVILATWEHPDMEKSFPALYFNHAIAVCKIDGEWVYMDPTTYVVPFGFIPIDDQDRNVLVFTEDGLIINKTPFIDSAKSVLKKDIVIEFTSDDAFTCSTLVNATGLTGAGMNGWAMYSMPEKVRQSLLQSAKSISADAEIINYQIDQDSNMDINSPFFLKIKWVGSQLFLNAGPYKMIPPVVSVSLDDVATEDRNYPIDLSMGKGVLVVNKEFVLPKGYEALYLPKDKSIRLKDILEFSISSSKRQDDNGRVHIVQKVVYDIKTPIIYPKQYKRYKKAKEEIARLLKDHILVKKTR